MNHMVMHGDGIAATVVKKLSFFLLREYPNGLMSLMRILASCTGTDICRGKKDIDQVDAFVKNARPAV
jgi:hypothetical protein